MDIKELTYPVFETNQVLSTTHLNDLFEYLDEQTRLTRANLIGIGIACGLEVSFEAPGTVHLSKGCGVTSQGYLVVEPTDLTLAHVRSYKLPTEYSYQQFVESGPTPAQQYPLWELFPAADDDEPGAIPLDTSGLPLEDMAVVLFVELSKDRARNCRPNNCDDRGATVTATTRRLLVDVADLDKVIAATSGSAETYLGADLTERLQLPDLRMPRVGVPNTGRVTPDAVLRAFQDAFWQNKLVAATGAALQALYAAFEPLVGDLSGNDPFTGFVTRFGFLDDVPATTAQVRFMQYYWDLFDDLLAAYDDVRWKGLDLMCACCPPAHLFPRHLMAGVLDPASHDAADYRHRFVRSPAVGDCVDRTREVRALFERLVNLVDSFTEKPPDRGIKATPSRWGEAPLSAKAIPYYYDQDGNPPVFQLWDPGKTAVGRADHNLGYRAEDFAPTPPMFVTDPLRFDLEPNNFLRIEGHLGKNVQSVLEELLSLKKSHRLPIEVVALRTGTFNENVEVDLSMESCRFRDLETLYETLKAELICFLVKQVQYFYDLPLEGEPVGTPVVPKLWLLKTFAPKFVARPGTLGHRIELGLAWQPGLGPVPILFEFAVALSLQSQVLALVGAMSDLGSRFSDDVRQVDFSVVGDRYRALVEIARRIEELRRGGDVDEPGLSDRLDDIVFRCRLGPFEAIAEEYKRRVREAKQASYLGHFLERHPGIQHKAGVPLGGTFVLVYHDLPNLVSAPDFPVIDRGDLDLDIEVDLGTAVGTDLGAKAAIDSTIGGTGFQLDDTKAKLLSVALARMQYKPELADDPDLQILYKVMTGNLLVPRPPASGFGEKIYREAIADLPDGTVIADFFLPYSCCSDCPPIQYQLPSARLRVNADRACTSEDATAEVTLTTEGASGSLSVQVDDGGFSELTGPLLLAPGDHTIVVRDASGNESSPVEIEVPPHLDLSGSEIVIDQAAGTYQVVATVQGGTPPYTTDEGTVVDTVYTSVATVLDASVTLFVQDAAGCRIKRAFESGVNPCDLPCGGDAIREGFRFWIPEPRLRLPINKLEVELGRFTIVDEAGSTIDVADKVPSLADILGSPATIGSTDFPRVLQRWLDAINQAAAEAVGGSDQWFHVEYEPASEQGTTGVLFVDRLDCIDFRFALSAAFVQGGREHKFELSYAPSGTTIVEPAGDTKLRIPPFGGSRSNKCRPDEPPVPVCEGTDLELELEREGTAPEVLVLAASVSGGPPVAFLWEVQDGIPSVSGGEKVAVKFDPFEPVKKLVRLTAFTENGCTVTIERVVDISGRDG